jgi:hypothetical protein
MDTQRRCRGLAEWVAVGLLVGCAHRDASPPPEAVPDAVRVQSEAVPVKRGAHEESEAVSVQRGAHDGAGDETSIRLPGGTVVDRRLGEVTVPAFVATTTGWLEQVACLVGTREHESLLVVETKPSEVHAGLLLLGLEPGQPGRWRYEDGAVRSEVPSGPAIELLVRWRDDEGEHERPLVEWVRGADGRSFPAEWVFAGSVFAPHPPSWKEPGQYYVADITGSLVGLVTFGDETIAARAVIPDLIDIEAANWQAWTERMPPAGHPAILVLRVAAPIQPR